MSIQKDKTTRILGKDFQININNEPVDEVPKIFFSGSTITSDEGTLSDVKSRIAKASYTFNTSKIREIQLHYPQNRN